MYIKDKIEKCKKILNQLSKSTIDKPKSRTHEYISKMVNEHTSKYYPYDDNQKKIIVTPADIGKIKNGRKTPVIKIEAVFEYLESEGHIDVSREKFSTQDYLQEFLIQSLSNDGKITNRVELMEGNYFLKRQSILTPNMVSVSRMKITKDDELNSTSDKLIWRFQETKYIKNENSDNHYESNGYIVEILNNYLLIGNSISKDISHDECSIVNRKGIEVMIIHNDHEAGLVRGVMIGSHRRAKKPFATTFYMQGPCKIKDEQLGEHPFTQFDKEMIFNKFHSDWNVLTPHYKKRVF